MIVVWSPITATEEVPPMGLELKKHLERLKGRVRHASCSSWALLCRVMKENGFPPGMVAFTETGKPFFKDSSVYFSLSHSVDLCAVAVSHQPVGVDIEVCRDKYNRRMIERSLTEKEKLLFDGDFTRVWCRKEAIAKMTGDGLSGYPCNIDTCSEQFLECRIDYEDRKYWLVSVEKTEHILMC